MRRTTSLEDISVYYPETEHKVIILSTSSSRILLGVGYVNAFKAEQND